MAKYRANYFYKNKLMSSASIAEINKESALESFKQSLSLDSTQDLCVELYLEQKIRQSMNQGFKIRVLKGSILVEKESNKKQMVRINWMNELNISAYYNEEEVEQIQQNIQAMMSFTPEEIVSEEGEISYTQFEFPNQIEERYKEIDLKDKETIVVESILPIETIEG